MFYNTERTFRDCVRSLLKVKDNQRLKDSKTVLYYAYITRNIIISLLYRPPAGKIKPFKNVIKH